MSFFKKIFCSKLDKFNQLKLYYAKKYHLVTCGFTTFNSENTIERALLSAIQQDYKNIELLIVDDIHRTQLSK